MCRQRDDRQPELCAIAILPRVGNAQVVKRVLAACRAPLEQPRVFIRRRVSELLRNGAYRASSSASFMNGVDEYTSHERNALAVLLQCDGVILNFWVCLTLRAVQRLRCRRDRAGRVEVEGKLGPFRKPGC